MLMQLGAFIYSCILVLAALHPSLFAELDCMEMTMPYQQRQDGARLVDDIFLYHLNEIITQRNPALINDSKLASQRVVFRTIGPSALMQ